jgi:hypothetical protein
MEENSKTFFGGSRFNVVYNLHMAIILNLSLKK